MRKFFISYSNVDFEVADWIDFVLKENGYTTFMQRSDIGPGSNFLQEMDSAYDSCEKLLFLLSRSSVQSAYARQELLAFVRKDPDGRNRLVIPIKLDDVKPKGILASIVYIDLFGVTDEEARLRLLNGVEHRLPPPKPHSLFPGSKIAAELLRPRIGRHATNTSNEELQDLAKELLADPTTYYPPLRERHLGRAVVTSLLPALVRGLKEQDRKPGLVMLDVDGMTSLNAKYGVEIGDVVISLVLDIAAADWTRVISGRMGDDSVFVLTQQAEAASLLELAQDMVRRIADYRWNRIAAQLRVTCSAGVSLFLSPDPEYDVSVAALACSTAKNGGGNQASDRPTRGRRPPDDSWQLFMS